MSEVIIFSFKYPSEDDNSSILSGSNYEVQSSPLSNSQNTSQQFPGLTQAALDPIIQEVDLLKENNKSLSEMVARLTEELHQYKVKSKPQPRPQSSFFKIKKRSLKITCLSGMVAQT
jgi:hypothetical protein